MAGYEVRSLKTLSQAARKYFTQSIDGAIASVWANTFTVTAKVIALVGQGLELRRAWLVRQLFASTADRLWLIRHGFELGLTLDPAAPALGSGTGASTATTPIPAGLQYARADGVVFNVLSPAAPSGGTVSFDLEADSPGAISNTEAGTSLALLDPADAPAGAPLALTVDMASDGAGLSGGADEEDIEAFRARVLFRKRNPPQGGSAADYAEWVQAAVPTATRVFVDSYQNDARAVWVQFLVSDQPYGIPTAGQIAAAQAYVSDPIRRPVTARVSVTAPAAAPVAVVIANLQPLTAAVVASVEAEIVATFTDRAEPGTPSAPFLFSASWISEAIARATGEDSHDLVSPGDLVFTAGQLPVLGSIANQ